MGTYIALEAKNTRLSYLIVEKGTIMNSLYNYPLYIGFFLLRKGWKLMTSRSSVYPKPGRQELWSIIEIMARQKELNIPYEEKVLGISKKNRCL